MAKVKPSIIEYSGAVGREIHYTRFGHTYSRQLPAEYNDRKSEAQLRQRALFKARQATSALYGSILQRGLTKETHENGMTEANYFSRLNKDHFAYEDGIVHINYSACIPTLSAAEKQTNKQHRNINRRVSNSIFINAIPISQY